jgi:Flp pilus assembly protein TadB
MSGPFVESIEKARCGPVGQASDEFEVEEALFGIERLRRDGRKEVIRELRIVTAIFFVAVVFGRVKISVLTLWTVMVLGASLLPLSLWLHRQSKTA